MDPITNQLSVGTQQQAQPVTQTAAMNQMQSQIGQPVTQTAVGGLTQANPTIGTQPVANSAGSSLPPKLQSMQNALQPNPLLSAMQTPTPTAQPSALMSNMSNFSTGIQNYLNPLSGGAQLTSNQSYTYDPASQTFYLNEVSPFGPGTSTPITMAEMQAKADAFAAAQTAQAANNPLLGQNIYQPNAAGTMQQMPVGPMPQVPLVPTGFPSTPYVGAQAAAPQGGLSQIPTVAQNNPAIPNAMAPMQGTPAYQRIMQVMNQMRQQMPQMSQFAGFNLPTGAQPNQAPAMDGSQNILNRLFSGSFGNAGAYNPFGNRFGFRNYERDQYGNPVAPPVMNNYQSRMPSLMQRYGMM